MDRYFIEATKWISAWEFKDIVYGLAVTIICAIAAMWSGLIRKITERIKLSRALRTYKKAISEEANILIVVGKRKGFALTDVYIALDIAKSDLMAKMPEDIDDRLPRDERAFVLVGGPGAGKSTTVKKEMLDTLQKCKLFPIFMRLRDYVGFDHLEAFIAHKLHVNGVHEPEQFLRDQLRNGKCMCILDGLDEVRPQLRAQVVEAINAFYHKYFVKDNRLIVTCRKEAYRSIPLDIPCIMEVRPLSDEQIQRFAKVWPPGYPHGKSVDTFWRDLTTTPRILELTRSPLLLVGGLMQYTESNLGIPEARSEYLGRVARWLVTDWATAQGHPADPYRQAYDRILSRLALLMHKQQSSEIERTVAERYIGEWLPVFGYNAASPTDVLESISTRTGILVSEEKEFVVFAQFGLQEYFASLELVDSMTVAALARLEPKDWWREVILLAVAQQREPTALLTELFGRAPLMAAAAVAECPTPSLAIQERAVKACLDGLDAGDLAVSGALIPLLRRLRGQLEQDLCLALEERLSGPEARASLVGIALATAGTDLATGILAKHPEIWDRCLKDAGYLSSNLENLLVDWIKKGTDIQSEKAANMIAVRLSTDRLWQLLDVLPHLAKPRADVAG